MMITRLTRFILLSLTLWCLAWPAGAIVIDLSEKQIDILYSFNGADLILFGTIGDTPRMDTDDFDVVIVVRGPELPTTVRQKQKVGGLIWVNKDQIHFPAAPGYYAVAANRPLSEIANQKTYAQTGIGFQNLLLATSTPAGSKTKKTEYQNALYRLRSGENLYRQEKDSVTMIGEGLFRTDVRLPANVPVGSFNVDAYVFEKGVLKARDRVSLIVDKAGFERALYQFAHTQSFFYGLTAVFIALVSGWLAGLLGKK